tara:strand:- start:4260 stop:4775 length:516 start_codon:yes stop_codon:yes gene_type:complete
MTTETLNKATVIQIRERLNAMLDIQDYLESMGLEGHFGNATFSDTTVTFKFEVKVAGSLDRKEQQKLDLLHSIISMQWEMTTDQIDAFLADIHEVRGDRIRFTGYNSRAKKMPIEFLNVGRGSHHKSVENYLSVALNSAGYKKRLPKGAIPAPSAAARAMAKAEAEWEAQQ